MIFRWSNADRMSAGIRSAGWDAVVIDEAHRMTLSAQAYYQLGRLMSGAPRVMLMTATPHRGKETLALRASYHSATNYRMSSILTPRPS